MFAQVVNECKKFPISNASPIWATLRLKMISQQSVPDIRHHITNFHIISPDKCLPPQAAPLLLLIG
jgi:hypothetical protein